MPVPPIKTEADYDWALREIEHYFDREPEPGTPAADRYDILAALIESYESRHWPIDAPDPIEAVRFRMKQAGYTQSDLARLISSKSRASELLNRRRPLTLEHAYRLHREWHIPADILIQPYHSDGAETQLAGNEPNTRRGKKVAA